MLDLQGFCVLDHRAGLKPPRACEEAVPRGRPRLARVR